MAAWRIDRDSAARGVPMVDVWECIGMNDAVALDALLRCCEWLAVDATNELGETALHVAASRGCDDVVRVLLRHRASITVKDMVHYGRRFARTYLHGTPDNEERSAMGLLSRRSADALQAEADAAPDPDSLRGGMVYTFGKRDYQLGYHLPNADVQTTPRRVELSISSPIRQISASKYHTIVLNAAGECFVWGFGKGGRLGTGTEFDHVEPTRIAYLEQIPIAKVAAGENHSLALSRSGQIFSWGSNSFGQLGQNSKTLTHQGRLTPKRIDAFKGLVMVEIAASGCHSAAVSSDADGGVVYTWGSNKKGQLGRKEGAGTDQPYPNPRPVDALILNHPLSAIYEDYDTVQATQLALSDWHSCVILRCTRNGKSHGQVWQFGYGSNCPTRVNFRDSKRRAGSVLLSETWVPTWAHRGTDIVQISCAQNHSIALASSGMVYTWGHNESALSHTANSKKARQRGEEGSSIPGAPRSVELSKYGPVTSICASQDHCAVVTQGGDLVTWGGGAQGVLGHGLENTWQPSPKRVPGVKKAVAVAAGHQHTVVLVAPSQPPISSMTASSGTMSLRGALQERIAQWLDISNCATVWKYAEDYDARELQAYCLDYMGRNWDAFLDLMCKERLETLFEMFLPPAEDLELERKSARVSGSAAAAPSMSPRPVTSTSGDVLGAFVLGGKTPSHVQTKKKIGNKPCTDEAGVSVGQASARPHHDPHRVAQPAVPKLNAVGFPDLQRTPPIGDHTISESRRRHGKFVPLDQFLSSSKSIRVTEGSEERKVGSGGDRAAGTAVIPGGLTSPWKIPMASPPSPTPYTMSRGEEAFNAAAAKSPPPVREGSIDRPGASMLPPRTRKESLGSHPSASPRVPFAPSPTVSSNSSSKSVLGYDGVERQQVATFSLDAFIKKPSRNSRKNRRGGGEVDDEPKPVVSWSGVAAGTSPASPSLTSFPASTLSHGSLPLKTLKEIQAEEEARIAAETAAKTRLGTYSRRTASTVNSWGLCEAQGHVSLADVQKLQEEQAFIEEQRQILEEIERKRAAAAKAVAPEQQRGDNGQGERRRGSRTARGDGRAADGSKKAKKKSSNRSDDGSGVRAGRRPTKASSVAIDATDGARAAAPASEATGRRKKGKKKSIAATAGPSASPHVSSDKKPGKKTAWKPGTPATGASGTGDRPRSGVPAA